MAWGTFATLESNEPILVLASPELGARTIEDLPAVVGELWGYLLDWKTLPERPRLRSRQRWLVSTRSV